MDLGDVCDVETTRNGIPGRVRGRGGNIGKNRKDQGDEEGSSEQHGPQRVRKEEGLRR